MENEIAKQSNLLPSAFITSAPRMTSSQQKLIEFLKDKAAKREAVSRDDIVSFYIHKHIGNTHYRVYAKIPHSNPDWAAQGYKMLDYNNWTEKAYADDWDIRTRATQWFKNNLGSCILKGKLLAIPVIEIE